MSIAIYPGSFDPITLGHVDIIKRLSPLFSRFIVLVAAAENKDYILSAKDRVDLIKETFNNQVEVETFDGLTVEFAKKVGAKVMVRGIRGVGDMENEMAMANVNKKLDPSIETLIVLAAPEYTCISSRLIKEVARRGGDLSQMLPDNVSTVLMKSLNS